jgi:hypothetical protein
MRQETLLLSHLTTGIYTVEIYSYAGTGSYSLDVSADLGK